MFGIMIYFGLFFGCSFAGFYLLATGDRIISEGRGGEWLTPVCVIGSALLILFGVMCGMIAIIAAAGNKL